MADAIFLRQKRDPVPRSLSETVDPDWLEGFSFGILAVPDRSSCRCELIRPEKLIMNCMPYILRPNICMLRISKSYQIVVHVLTQEGCQTRVVFRWPEIRESDIILSWYGINSKSFRQLTQGPRGANKMKLMAGLLGVLLAYQSAYSIFRCFFYMWFIALWCR